MRGKARAEWDRLDEVIIHKPGIEAFFGLLAPEASLYEGPFDYQAACREHDRLKACLSEDFQVQTHELRDIIVKRAESDENFRARLIKLALSAVGFEGENKEKHKENFRKTADAHCLGDLVDMLVLRPSVEIVEFAGEKLPRTILRRALFNLYYMRDQQAIADNGVILGHPYRPQREFEPALTKLAFEALKVKVAREINLPGTFEGGDFMSMKNFALIGKGQRTNDDAIAQILSCLSFEEVAVVENPFHKSVGHPDDTTMHLDTYFNVAGDDVVVGHKKLAETASVTVYQKEGEKYNRLQEKSHLLPYIKGKGFRLVPITTLEQLSYASNFLCIKNRCILAVDVENVAKRVIADLNEKIRAGKVQYQRIRQEVQGDYEKLNSNGDFFPHKKQMRDYGVDYEHISIKNLSAGFGGIHCMTCGLSRS